MIPHSRIPTLAVNMMVRNAGHFAIRALDSLGIFVDEFVIVDTGSSDDTRAIIERWYEERGGRRRFHLLDFTPANHPEAFLIDEPAAWNTGFAIEAPGPFSGHVCLADWSAPRNLALDRTTCEYVIHLDADDIVENPEKLRKLIAIMSEQELDLALLPYSYRHDPVTGATTSQHPRERVGRREKVWWEGIIHEQMVTVDPTKTQAFEGVLVVDCHDCTDEKARIPNRALKLLIRAYNAGDRSPRTLYHLAMESRENQPDLALTAFAGYLSATSGAHPHRAVAYVERARIMEYRDQFGPAAVEYSQALRLWPKIPEAEIGLGRLAYYDRRWQDCISHMERAIELSSQPAAQLIPHDPVERQARTRLLLALAYAHVGRHEDAMAAHDLGAPLLPAEFASLRRVLESKAA